MIGWNEILKASELNKSTVIQWWCEDSGRERQWIESGNKAILSKLEYLYMDHLSWISAPLTVGIEDRVDETVRALMSNKLLNNEGLVTRSGEKTFWDRSSLYALRGMFLCGKAEDAYALLTRYSSARLLGEHIPYCVEAFPEGNQAQLSAESGLYLRIYSEGILGYRPTGFNSFEIKPDLPEGWNEFAIRNMKL